MKRTNKKIELGEDITFEIKNPNWAKPITMTGKVKAIQSRFNGVICIEKGAICEDEFIIRTESIKQI